MLLATAKSKEKKKKGRTHCSMRMTISSSGKLKSVEMCSCFSLSHVLHRHPLPRNPPGELFVTPVRKVESDRDAARCNHWDERRRRPGFDEVKAATFPTTTRPHRDAAGDLFHYALLQGSLTLTGLAPRCGDDFIPRSRELMES